MFRNSHCGRKWLANGRLLCFENKLSCGYVPTSFARKVCYLNKLQCLEGLWPVGDHSMVTMDCCRSNNLKEFKFKMKNRFKIVNFSSYCNRSVCYPNDTFQFYIYFSNLTEDPKPSFDPLAPRLQAQTSFISGTAALPMSLRIIHKL